MYLLSFSISPNKTLNVSAASNFPGTNITTGAANVGRYDDESDCYRSFGGNESIQVPYCKLY